MKRVRADCAALLLMLGIVPWGCMPQAPLVVVTLDPGVRHQRIDGLGGAASQPEHLRALPEPTRSEVMDLVFGDLAPSMVRLRIPHTIEPLNDDADPAVSDPAGFVAPEDLLWQQQQLFARADPVLVGAPWSPPAWMKDSGETCCGGSLLPGMEPELAEWLSAALEFLADGGHPLDHLSIQNEPEVVAFWDTNVYSPPGLAVASEAVAQRLVADGHATRLVTPDSGASFMTLIYGPEVMAQPTAAARTSAIAFHLYQVVRYFDPASALDWFPGPASVADQYGLPLWMTEYSNIEGDYGSHAEAMALAQHLHYALANDVAAYLIWNLYYPWGVGEALVHISQSGAADYTITPKFYTAKHYLRYVRRGAVRIGASSDDEEILATAFVQEDDRQLVVVVVNPTGAARNVGIATGLGPLGTPEVIRTSPGENAVSIAPALPDLLGPQIVHLPAEAVVTLVWPFP